MKYHWHRTWINKCRDRSCPPRIAATAPTLWRFWPTTREVKRLVWTSAPADLIPIRLIAQLRRRDKLRVLDIPKVSFLGRLPLPIGASFSMPKEVLDWARPSNTKVLRFRDNRHPSCPRRHGITTFRLRDTRVQESRDGRHGARAVIRLMFRPTWVRSWRFWPNSRRRKRPARRFWFLSEALTVCTAFWRMETLLERRRQVTHRPPKTLPRRWFIGSVETP